MAHYSINTAKAREGKLEEAKKSALAAAKYLNDTYGANIQILANYDGNRNVLHWVSYNESWATQEEIGKKLAQDATLQKLIATINESIDLFNGEWHLYSVVESGE